MSAELFTSNFTKYPNVDAQLRFYVPLLERLESQPGVVVGGDHQRGAAAHLAAVHRRLSDRRPRRRRSEPAADGRRTHRQRELFQDARRSAGARPRFTDADDRDTQKVVVINKAMMRYWDAADPIGSRISLDNGRRWRDRRRHRRRREAVRPRQAGGRAGLHAAAADDARARRAGAAANQRRAGGGGADPRRSLGDRSRPAGCAGANAR